MDSTLTLRPIGHLRSGKHVKFHARHQPRETEAETNVLELSPGENFEVALRDLAGFSRVWLVWWFHRNTDWRPLVLPPRGPAKRRGVFATRSPHRPNPLGLTPVQLLGVEGRTLLLGPCDLVDGTPVFDVKPYIPAYDAFPAERAGWLDEVEALAQEPPRFAVALHPRAQEQAEWLRAEWRIDFRPRLLEMLARDPTPHRTRRIGRDRLRRTVITCGAWRAVFTVSGDRVDVSGIEPAFPRKFLDDLSLTRVPERAAQLAFLARWPDAELPAAADAE